MQYLNRADLQPRERDVKLEHLSKARGGDVGVKVRSLDTLEMASGAPAVVANSDAFNAMPPEEQQKINIEWEKWGNLLISRACIEPQISPEEASRIGLDRADLIQEIIALSQGSPEPLRPFRAVVHPDGQPSGADVEPAADGHPGDAVEPLPAEHRLPG